MCDAIFMVLSLSILGVFRGISINSVRNLERERKKNCEKLFKISVDPSLSEKFIILEGMWPSIAHN